ncbi:MAG: hypothetical protein HHJ12_04330 [Glaciimonas sp.]|nr:hypothetical protein [Glaciimonas sp.]
MATCLMSRFLAMSWSSPTNVSMKKCLKDVITATLSPPERGFLCLLCCRKKADYRPNRVTNSLQVQEKDTGNKKGLQA